MLRLSTVVKRLRAACPVFENRVAGTATFVDVSAKAGEQKDIAVPLCFVIPMEELNITPPGTETISTSVEKIRESFATVVCVDNSIQGASPVGSVLKLSAMDMISEIEENIRDAFSDWRPAPKYDLVRFLKGRHIAMDGKRLWHQFEWMVEYDSMAGTTDSMDDAINDIILGVTEGEDDPFTLHKIHVTVHPPEDEMEFPDLVVPRYPPDPVIPEPTEEQLAAKEAGEDCEIDVNPPPPPADDPNAEEIGEHLTIAHPPFPFEPGEDRVSMRLLPEDFQS